MKRLALFLDGTWNDSDDNTNVWRLKLMLARPAFDGVRQLAYYHRGVGTSWHDRVSGGAFGRGVSRNVCRAYQWLMEHYDLGDEVYLLGFSRGAFTARSLAGMIAKCGLLMPEAPLAVPEVFDYYRQGDTPLYRLEYLDRHPERGGHLWQPRQRTLLRFSKRIPIRFVGVFDTVGSLGVPIGRYPGVSRRELTFHHTRLSKLFEHAYQALAIDEHRGPYRPSLWRRFLPTAADGTIDRDVEAEGADAEQRVEQRWFVGAHANVGGGYRSDPLAQIPLHWMQQRAADAGLGFRRLVERRGDEHLTRPCDSYAEFLRGAYRIATFGRRHYRTIRGPAESRVAADGTAGRIETVNETIDGSVLRRWNEDPTYRPPNLAASIEGHGLTIGREGLR